MNPRDYQPGDKGRLTETFPAACGISSYSVYEFEVVSVEGDRVYTEGDYLAIYTDEDRDTQRWELLSRPTPQEPKGYGAVVEIVYADDPSAKTLLTHCDSAMFPWFSDDLDSGTWESLTEGYKSIRVLFEGETSGD